MTTLSFVLGFRLTGKERPRFNSYTGHAYTPQKTHQAERLIGLVARAEMVKQGIKMAPAGAPVSFDIEAIYAIPESYSKRKKAELDGKPCTGKPDSDNAQKLLFDALNGIVYPDDKSITDIRFRKRYGPSDRVNVSIYW